MSQLEGKNEELKSVTKTFLTLTGALSLTGSKRSNLPE
jgi:hypothetical protein